MTRDINKAKSFEDLILFWNTILGVYEMARTDKFDSVFVCFILFLVLDCSRFAVSQSRVRYLPGFNGPLPFELETGYVGVDDSGDVQLFYYFIKSERSPSEDPLVVWISGGPGCSSFTGLAYEIGPLYFRTVRYDGSLPTLVLNPHSWTKVSNIIFLDSPVNSGFSYSKTLQGSYTGDIKTSQHTHHFLKKWLVDHPEFLTNPVYIGGDSYSGMTVPIIVQDISDGIEAGQEPLINLKGYLLGNPATDNYFDSNSKIPFVHGMGLISDELFEAVKKSCNEQYVDVGPGNKQCIRDLQAVSECISRLNTVHILEPRCARAAPKPKMITDRRALTENSSSFVINPPPVPAFNCRSYAYMLSYYWANNEKVQRALNIRKGTVQEWIRCNYDGVHYTQDVVSSVGYHQTLSRRNYRSLIYSGDHDYLVPYLSTQAWIRSLNYSIIDEWRPWFVDGQIAGYTRKYANNMTFTTVKGGGHTAPEYWPRECLAMFTRWLSHDPL